MLLRWIALILVAAALQASDDGATGVGWRDDVIDVTQLCGAIRVGELGLILLDALLLLLWGLLAIEDRDGTLGTHHGNLGALVGEIDIGTELLAVHHDVGTSVCLAGDEGDLRHGSLSIGIEQLGTMTNDAAVLLIDAWHEAGDILDGDDRDVEAVAETNETCALLRGIDIQSASEDLRLIGQEADGATCHAAEADDEVLGEVWSDLEEILMVADRLDDVLDVVWDVRIGWHYALELVTLAGQLVGGGVDRGILHVVAWEEADELTDGHEALLVRVAHKLADTRLGAVDIGTAEGLLVALLLGDLLHYVRTGDEHLCLLAHHEDEVGQGWRIAAATGTWAHDGRDLWDDARRLHIAIEDVAKTRERLDALLDAGTTRVVEADDRCAILESCVLHLGNLGSIGRRERASEDGEIEGIDEDEATIDLAIATYDTVACHLLVLHAEVGAMVLYILIYLDESSFVEQDIYTFTNVEFLVFHNDPPQPSLNREEA